MQARSAKQVIGDLQKIADQSLKDHQILEDVEVNEREGYWLIGRPNSSAYRTQISVLKFGVLHAHGDAGMAMWEHFHSDDMSRLNVLRWMATRPTHDSYMAEKASIAMGGRTRVYEREADVALWEAQQHLEEILDRSARKTWDALELHPEDLDPHDRQEILMWRQVCSLIEEGYQTLEDIDRYIYETSGDPELCGLGATLGGDIIWSHFLVRKLWALLVEKGIVE